MDQQRMELEKLKKEIWADYEDVVKTIARHEMMDAAVLHENHFIPRIINWFFPVSAITIGKNIFCKEDILSRNMLHHELIHMEQQREMGLLNFFIRYLGYYLIGLIRTRSHYDAYLLIPFEQEAYKNQDNREYIWEREPECWREYDFKGNVA